MSALTRKMMTIMSFQIQVRVAYFHVKYRYSTDPTNVTNLLSEFIYIQSHFLHIPSLSAFCVCFIIVLQAVACETPCIDRLAINQSLFFVSFPRFFRWYSESTTQVVVVIIFLDIHPRLFELRKLECLGLCTYTRTYTCTQSMANRLNRTKDIYLVVSQSVSQSVTITCLPP